MASRYSYTNTIKDIDCDNFDYTLIFESDANIETPVDDFIEVFNGFFIFTASKIQAGNFVIKNQNAVPVKVRFIRC